MSKIFFFNIPAYGHTNPTLALVKELTRRGHQVYYYSIEQFRSAIEGAGGIFMGYDNENIPAPNQGDGDKIGKDLVYAVDLIVNMTAGLDKRITEDTAKISPDCIIADSVAYWGKLASIKFSLPFVSSTTTFAFNRYSAGEMEREKGGLLKMLFSMPKIRKSLKRLQDMGYPVKSFLDIIQNDNDTRTIVYTSPEFQPFSETFSDKYTFAGPLVRHSEKEISDSENKAVFVSLGTVNNQNRQFFENCIEAFRDRPFRVIISAGAEADSIKSGVGENIEVYKTVDQIAVLEKTDVFITHCGMNSASEALYMGVPLVLFPQTPEQSAVAKRAHDLGAGEYLKNTSPEEIFGIASAVLNGEKYKAAAENISRGFKACGGAKAAADAVENAMGMR